MQFTKTLQNLIQYNHSHLGTKQADYKFVRNVYLINLEIYIQIMGTFTVKFATLFQQMLKFSMSK